MLIDLHNHTWPRSHDSVLSVEDLIERARAAGLDGVCLTEHDAVWTEPETQTLCEEHNFLVLPGAEISTDDGHILAYGIEEYVFGMHRVHRLSDHVEERGGVLIAAHPYRRQIPWTDKKPEEWPLALEKAAANPAYQYCVALERINGRGNERENRFSADLCDHMHLPGTGGTDSHAVHDIGKVATYFESEQIHDLRDLIGELRGGRFCAVDLTTQQELPGPRRRRAD